MRLATRTTHRAWTRAVGLVVAVVVAASAVESRAQELAVLNLMVPTTAAGSGFAYRYDPSTGAFERDTTMTGQVFLERPEPVGKGRWNVHLLYLWFAPDTLNGRGVDADDLHMTTIGVTYGAGDDLDLDLTVPVLAGRGVTVDPIFLRAKYRVLRKRSVEASLGVTVRMLTDRLLDEDASSRVQAGPYLYVAADPHRVWRSLRLRPYLNLGAAIDEVPEDTSLRWGIGVDSAFRDVAVFSAAVLGRHYLTAGGFVLSPFRADLYDFAAGWRVRLWRDDFAAVVHALLPLNDDGLRADVISVGGLEATF